MPGIIYVLRFFGAGVIDGCGQELNLGPLEEQSVFLTAEPSLPATTTTPPILFFYTLNKVSGWASKIAQPVR